MPADRPTPPASTVAHERVITNADFVRALSYMASNCGSWAGDSLIFPEEMPQPMKLEPLRRFIAGMRERLDRIDPDKPDA